MEKALENKDLPPQERARIEQALNAQSSGPQNSGPLGASLKVTKTGKTGRQQGISCEWYKQLEIFDVPSALRESA